jgi:hypothetical protein
MQTKGRGATFLTLEIPLWVFSMGKPMSVCTAALSLLTTYPMNFVIVVTVGMLLVLFGLVSFLGPGLGLFLLVKNKGNPSWANVAFVS